MRNVWCFFCATPDPTVNMDALDALDAMDGLNIVDTVCNVTGTGLSLGSLIAKVTQRKCSILFSNESSNYTLCNPW